MKKIVAGFLALAVAMPAQAAGWDPGAETRYGAFVGARLQVPLGGKKSAAPRAELTLAPTHSRISSAGLVETRIGHGIALDFAAKGRPALTLGGMRADTALRLQRGGTTQADKKLGISTAGWIGIGVGVAAIAGGLYFVHLVREADKNSD